MKQQKIITVVFTIVMLLLVSCSSTNRKEKADDSNQSKIEPEVCKVDTVINDTLIQENGKVHDIFYELYCICHDKTELKNETDTLFWDDCDWEGSISKMFGRKATDTTFCGRYKTINEIRSKIINAGFVEEEETSIGADFNEDGLRDYIMVIKGTDSSKIVPWWHDNTMLANRNPRGILAIVNKSSCFEVVMQNTDFLDSGEEDGGVYFAPEMDLEIRGNCLYINYWHGRYGSWYYKFKFKNNDFEFAEYSSAESLSYIAEMLRYEKIDFEKNIISYSTIINQDDFINDDDFDESLEPLYYTIILPFHIQKPYLLSEWPSF
ncbi:MAG: hypothetical protein PUG15_00685 [Bacteroidales bacterium]|nr:hypothetical protein [Bacteroidales bacterium]